MSHYTEDTLVQQTTAEYLEKKLGWDSVYAYNDEAFGEDGTLGRRNRQEVIGGLEGEVEHAFEEPRARLVVGERAGGAL